jgi:phospholipid/cholesterol/gamma-HCH transport system permease protein
MSARADFALDSGEGGTLHFKGSLTLAAIGDLPARLRREAGKPSQVDLANVERMDTVGAWLVHRLVRDSGAEVTGASDEEKELLDQVAAADHPAKIRPDKQPSFLRVLNDVGEATRGAFQGLVGLVGFLGGIIVTLFSIFTHPRRLRWNAIVRQCEVVGVEALAIVGLMSFLIGIVIAQQGAIQLRQFGAEVYTINLVGRLTFRELGVLMTAIMVAGRSGSAFAAQIGSMRLAEEVDAMRTIGVAPMEALVAPRFIAATIMMPLLSYYAAMVALLGGALFAWISLDIPPAAFIQRIRDVVPVTDALQTLIKAPVFGILIAISGCYQGMQVEGNAEAVGLRTTAAVVQSIFLAIVLDAFFAVFFAKIGWI